MLRADPRRDGRAQALRPSGRRPGAHQSRRLRAPDDPQPGRAPAGPPALLQPRRHQRARPPVPPLSARAPPALALPGGAARPPPGTRDRGDELQRPPRLRPARRLRRAPRPRPDRTGAGARDPTAHPCRQPSESQPAPLPRQHLEADCAARHHAKRTASRGAAGAKLAASPPPDGAGANGRGGKAASRTRPAGRAAAKQ